MSNNPKFDQKEFSKNTITPYGEIWYWKIFWAPEMIEREVNEETIHAIIEIIELKINQNKRFSDYAISNDELNKTKKRLEDIMFYFSF